MDDNAKKRLFFKIIMGVRDDGTVDLTHDGQTVVSPATYYRLLDELEKDGKIMKVARGTFSCLLPPTRAKSPILRNMMGMLADFSELVSAFNRFQDSYMNRFWKTVEESIEQCMACESYHDCMTGKRKDCKLEREPLSGPEIVAAMGKLDAELKRMIGGGGGGGEGGAGELFSPENCNHESTLIDHTDLSTDRERVDQDRMQFSRENNSEKRSEVGERSGVEDHRTEEARAILRSKIHESSVAPKERTGREMKAEVWKVWTECMEKRWPDVHAGKLMGKEGQLMVQLIAAYGLELTKKAIAVYFDQWDNLKAQNPWIDSPVPNVVLFYKLRERIFPAVSGKVQVTERVSRRTADEYDENDRSETRGRWPDREDPKATSPA